MALSFFWGKMGRQWWDVRKVLEEMGENGKETEIVIDQNWQVMGVLAVPGFLA